MQTRTPPILTPPETPGSSSGLQLHSPTTRSRPYHFSTLCATVENPGAKDQYGSSSVPIYQTATFKGVGGEYDYSRSGNPTRSHLEHHLAKISSARHAFAVSSGMAALDVVTRLLKAGDEVIAGDDLYGGTNRLLSYLKTHQDVTVHHVDTTQPETLHPLLKRGKTAMVLLESPTNPLLKIADLATICADIRARAPEAIIVVDNTMMSPYLQRPLEHGADVVYDSGTKYLSGHHDLMAGNIAFVINAVGNALTPFDSFLLLRGTKTLAIRMERQQASALVVARYLSGLGFLVHYPGLEQHPGYEVHKRLATGPGAVLSFTTGDKEMSERIVGAARLWGISVSFGAVNSLISMPCVMSHASIDPAVRAARGLPEDLIRLCVGIEDPSDLLDDLELALLQAGAIKPLSSGLSAGQTHVRTNPTYNPHAHGVAINKAIEKLADRMGNQSVEDRGRDWVVSAPGKVILFGEHAVVHGVTAIAASVDLRCYAASSGREDGKVQLNLPDLGFSHTWDIETELPWEALQKDGHLHTAKVLDKSLVDAITTKAIPPATGVDERYKVATVAFLYVYMNLAADGYRPSMTFTARSTLPVGAGLGSSAALSTCIASTLLLTHGRVLVPSDTQDNLSATTDMVNGWAFLAEKVLHGNPSGVDNAVSVHGGAIAFTRTDSGPKMVPIHGFKSIRFLLVNTKVPRDTKSLVAGVGLKKQEEPELVNGILSQIQQISDDAFAALSADPPLPRPELLSILRRSIEENHGHLVTLGVSHQKLERIREVVDKFGGADGLQTKLTGAGGGGCAVTLVPDGFDEGKLRTLVKELEMEGFEAYETSVGGGGYGVMIPIYSGSSSASMLGEKEASLEVVSSSSELARWSDAGAGRWIFS
ncbi:cystathionine beta-lyase [Tulasnella sp. 331]|nr:cystathionine beta-lyase [Tulasnella sp. 331]